MGKENCTDTPSRLFSTQLVATLKPNSQHEQLYNVSQRENLNGRVHAECTGKKRISKNGEIRIAKAHLQSSEQQVRVHFWSILYCRR
jgi:hypothetical protein